MDWPIIDRPAIHAEIELALAKRPARAVVLRGPSGVGKTTAARAVADAWSSTGRQVHHVVALAELQGAPLAAFVPLLARLGHDSRAATEINAHQTIAALGALAATALLVVDDAPLLDDASAAVIYHLVRAYALPTLLTVRSGHISRGPLERLDQEGLTSTIEIGGLSCPEVESVLRMRLGAAPRPDDVGRLESQTAGNPLQLRELIDLAERCGLTRQVPAGIEIDPVEFPSGFGASLASRVERLSTDQQAVLRLVALGAGTPANTLLSSDSERMTADALIQEGFIVTRPDRSLNVAHPSYREAAVAGLSALERDQVLAEVAQRLTENGDHHLRFIAVRLLCETSAGPSRVDLEWAVRRAFAMGEYLIAQSLAERTHDVVPTCPLRFPAAIDLASSLSALGNLDAADDAFEAADRASNEPADRVLLASRWGAHLAYRRFDVNAALALAARIKPSLTTADAALMGPDMRTWRILAGEVLAERHDPALGIDDSAPADAVIRAAIASVMLNSMGGRISDEAADILIQVEREHGILDPFAADMVHLQRYFALLSRGNGSAAAKVCEERRAICSPVAVGLWSLTLGIHRQYGGRLGEADILASLAVEQLRWRDPLGLLGFAIALCALVKAQQRQHETARELLGELDATQNIDPKTAMLVAETRAHLLFADGDIDAAADLMLAAAATALAAGHELVAAIGLGLCIRLDRADRTVGLLRLITAAVGPGMGLYEALDATAAGLIASDPDAILTAATRLADAGMIATAIDALLLAERLAPRQGQNELRRKIERLRTGLATLSDAPTLQAQTKAGALSIRESAVIELVLIRLSSREIAGELGISVRTVDNHLAKAFRKLGVSNRAELRAVLN